MTVWGNGLYTKCKWHNVICNRIPRVWSNFLPMCILTNCNYCQHKCWHHFCFSISRLFQLHYWECGPQVLGLVTPSGQTCLSALLESILSKQISEPNCWKPNIISNLCFNHLVKEQSVFGQWTVELISRFGKAIRSCFLS